MKLADVLITTLVKRGLNSEMKNFKTTFEVPNRERPLDPPIKITVTADTLQIKVEKE